MTPFYILEYDAHGLPKAGGVTLIGSCADPFALTLRAMIARGFVLDWERAREKS